MTAFLFAAHYKLDNLCVIIDLNGLQIDGATKDVMNTAPVNDKMRAFGLEIAEIDGQDLDAMTRRSQRSTQTAAPASRSPFS